MLMIQRDSLDTNLRLAKERAESLEVDIERLKESHKKFTQELEAKNTTLNMDIEAVSPGHCLAAP